MPGTDYVVRVSMIAAQDWDTLDTNAVRYEVMLTDGTLAGEKELQRSGGRRRLRRSFNASMHVSRPSFGDVIGFVKSIARREAA